LQRLAALEAENARIRALLGSRPRGTDRVAVGEILAVDMDPLRHRVILDKGGRDGVREGQALIDARGVAGQVTRDQGESAEAILITDPDHAVPVEVVRNGLRTIAMGTGDLERLTLPFLTRNADIKPGDLLVTSGLGGSFPAGYPVGTVTTVDGSSGDAFLEVDARPAASLDRLHEVLIVFDARGTAPAAAAPGPAVSTPAATPEREPAPSRPGPPVSTPPPAATPAAAGTPPETPTPVPPATATPPAVDPAPAAVTPPEGAPATEPTLPEAAGPAAEPSTGPVPGPDTGSAGGAPE
jgi:rod shape-determining protein MreC